MLCGSTLQIIERTALDHPHHTLFILLALANADKDEKYLSGTRKAATSRLTRKPSKGVVEMVSKVVPVFTPLWGGSRGESVHREVMYISSFNIVLSSCTVM